MTISIYLVVLLYSVKSNDLSQAFGFHEAHFGFGLILFSILLIPIDILFDLIVSHISRQFEYQADYYAASHGYKIDMEESLKILARENFSNLTPHPIFVAFKYSHPPIAKRIQAIRKV